MINKFRDSSVYINYEHNQVHSGQMYSANYYATIKAASLFNMQFVTGSLTSHAELHLAVSGQSKIRFIENITNTAAPGAGQTITVFNMKRTVTNSCTAKFWHSTAWSTNTEAVLVTELLPGGDHPTSRIGSSSRSGAEWILKPLTNYLIEIANQAGATIGASLTINFYEKPSG